MKFLAFMLIPILSGLAFNAQTSIITSEKSSLTVLQHKWSKTRLLPGKVEPPTNQPVKLESRVTRHYERNRVNEPVGARDPYLDTAEGRSAEIEKNVQEARTRVQKPIDAFEYRIKVHNANNKMADIVFWEYQFIDSSNPARSTRRQFLCSVKIGPDKEKEIQAFSFSGPSEVISVEGLSNSSANVYKENVVINRVEYVDGTIWQRQNWKFAEIRLSYSRVVTTPWGKEMCRGL